MFDTIEIIFDGLIGKLKQNREGRKLVWLLILTFLGGWFCTAFAGWISYPSYRNLIQYLPGADVISIFFTGVVALFIYFALMYESGYAMEGWLKVPESQRNYTKIGAKIIGVGCVGFLVVDVSMNLAGVGYRASEAAGAVATFTYEMPASDRAALASAQAKLNEIEAGKIGGYGWRDPKTGIFWLNDTGKKAAAEIRATVTKIQDADATSRDQFIADKEAANAARTAIEMKVQKTLKGGVYGVYVMVFLLSLVSAYIVERIQRDAQRPQTAQNQQRQASTYQNLTNTPIVPGGGNSSLVNSIQAEPAPMPIVEPMKVLGGWEITCKHCGQKAVKSRPAIYCGDACKTAAYEERSGKTLKRIPQSARMTPISYK